MGEAMWRGLWPVQALDRHLVYLFLPACRPTLALFQRELQPLRDMPDPPAMADTARK
jgi:hypothetical protein